MSSTAPLFAVLVLALGCSINVSAQPAQSGEAPPVTAGNSDYRIGAGDTLQIFVWRQPELSGTVPVRPDGRISTPLIDDLVAVGKTPTQLKIEIEQALAEFVRSPEVNVIVQQFVGTFAGQIRVLGQVTEPKNVPYRDGLTLLDVITEVGGLTEFAAGNKSRVVRTENGVTTEIRVRLKDLMQRGKIKENIPMKPGDVLVVPEAIF